MAVGVEGSVQKQSKLHFLECWWTPVRSENAMQIVERAYRKRIRLVSGGKHFPDAKSA